jgi:tetratricopeptide (TPR) repeat protein
MASNIPKFASFRPKPKAPVETPKPEEPPRSAKSSRRSEKPSNSSKVSSTDPCGDRNALVMEKEDNSSYIIDRKGDISNLTYGSLNRYSIPLYRRYGYGCIMGISSDRRIDRDRTTEQELVLTPARNRRPERLLTSKQAGREKAQSLRFVRPVGNYPATHDLDYITFSSGKRRKLDIEDEIDDVDYRSIEGKAKSVEPLDPDLKYESSTELDDTTSVVTQKNSLLTQRTRDEPHNLQAWLDLVDHQEAMMSLGRSSLELSPSDKQHLADIKVSTYEQALRKVGNDPDSQIKLQIGIMTEASLTWDDAKLSSKWAELLAKFPTNLELWARYLDFIETSVVSFKYESCRATFQRCLNSFRSSADTVLPETYLYVMVRLTSMIQQAGYQELALALWQALLEFNLLPLSPNGGDVSLDLFEEFWDSEVARIGEPDAKGWQAFNSELDHPAVEGPPASALSDQAVTTLEVFHKRELEYTAALKYPGRTTDEVGEDDPFHLILFSDVEEVLKVLPRNTPSLQILEAFLCFCRLPPLPYMGSYQQRWLDPFLRHANKNASARSDQSTVFTHSLARYLDCPIAYFQMTTELLLDRAFSDNAGPIDVSFIRRVLTLLVADASCDEMIGEYLLALELKFFPTEAFKTAKRMLKTRPTSLRLYNAYGLVESRRGNSAKADQVFGAALSMQKDATPLSIRGSLQLFNSWVWEALRRDEPTEALWRLVSPKGAVPKGSEGDNKTPDQTALLRGRSMLTDAYERALLGQDFPSAIICTSMLALLGYLSNSQKYENALLVHDNLSAWFSDHKLSHSSFAELHAQSVAQFLTYHATHSPIVKPSLIRSNLEPLIIRFPSNTILLSLYAANESRFSIDDRVRSIMSQNITQNDKERSLASWFFAIHFETLRSEIASTSNSVRALFRKAEVNVGAHSPALWRRHLLFELQQHQEAVAKRPLNKRPRRDGKKRTAELVLEESARRVRDTFFEGLTKLPWCKEYMMMGFGELGDVLGSEDKRRVYRLMLEKELRIYVELDERVA